MNTPRRLFLTQASLIAGAVVLKPGLLSAKNVNVIPHSQAGITIYHTNDLQGNINPVYKNVGGLRHIKAELEKTGIKGTLLDAGGFMNSSQSTDNLKQFIYLMNTAGYQAAGISKYELSRGEEHLATLIPSMQFTLLNCNHHFNGQLGKMIKPYITINHGEYKIGVTGVCSPLKGIKYNDAVESANRIALLLKNDQKCDLVICLSHLDGNDTAQSPDNIAFAAQSENIDIIIAGNSEILLSNATILRNKAKHEVTIAQAGYNGLMFGRTIIGFDDNRQKNSLRAKHFIPGLPNGQSYAASVVALQQAKDIPSLT